MLTTTQKNSRNRPIRWKTRFDDKIVHITYLTESVEIQKIIAALVSNYTISTRGGRRTFPENIFMVMNN